MKRPYWFFKMKQRKNRIKKQYFVKVKKEEQKEISSPPFFTILNEEGTIRRFLNALHHDQTEQARACLSSKIELDLEDARTILGEDLEYKKVIRFSKEKQHYFHIVSIALGKKEEIFHLCLVQESDWLSPWKIICIQRG